MKIKPVVLIGGRAELVPMEHSHVEGLFEAAGSEEIWDYMPMRVERLDDMKKLVETALLARAKGSEFPFVIIDQENDEIVGSTRFLDISIPNRNLEIGWTWLNPKVWRTRINTECKFLLLKHCFENLQTVRVQIKTDARNIRSQRAIERLGAVKEGVLRRHRILHDGFIRDTVYTVFLMKNGRRFKQG
ncbi:GNAT family N-acetyltransferase [Effusibacillus consociatus]|uniref:GNAT family N-acetyltransferase n=1 Tax=Effusibacillus consociatus TaxID=1117041 RepID=A0ABV9Q725_9BACL